ncbi:MAG TPA: NADH-quinone oxidoreductase subunit J [Acidobacteriota bacterium]
MGILVFWVFAALAVAAALVVILHRDIVRSALALIVCLGSLAVLFAQLSSPFLAALQVLLYAGAIMMLFLFVIMMLRRDQPRAPETPRLKRQAATLLAVFLWGLLTLAVGGATVPAGSAAEPLVSLPYLSRVLFFQYLYPFELISLLILTAIVGVVVLTKKRI